MSPAKDRNLKLPIFFNWNWRTFQVFRGFEQLSSSISWWVMAFSQNGQGYVL